MDSYYYSDFTISELNTPSDRFVSVIKPQHPHDTFYRHHKRRRTNPIGDEATLLPDGRVRYQLSAIIAIQRRFREWYWHPDGPGSKSVLKKYLGPTDGKDKHQTQHDGLPDLLRR